MATSAVDIVIRARNEASRVLAGVANELGGISSRVGALTAGTGVFGALATAAVAFGGAAVVAGRNLADTAEELERTAKATDTNVRSLQVYRQIVRDMNGDVGGLDKALVELTRSIDRGDPLLEQLGITTKDTDEAFLQLVRTLAASDDVGRKTNIAIALMGKSAKALVPELDAIANNFDRVNQRARESGELLGEDLVASGARLDEQFDTLGRNWRATWNSMAEVAVPVANVILGKLNELYASLRGAPTLKLDADATIPEVEKRLVDVRQEVERIQALQKATGGIGGLNASEDTARWQSRLVVLRRELTGLEEQLRRLASNAAPAGEANLPVVGGTGRDKESPRERQIKEIVRLLGMGEAQAARFASELDRIADAERTEALFRRVGVPPQEAGLEELIRGVQAGGGGVTPERRPGVPSSTGPVSPIELLVDSTDAAAARWIVILQDMTDAANQATDLIGTAWLGANDITRTVIDGLLGDTDHFAERMVDTIKNMVGDILAHFARLHLARLFLGFLGAPAAAIGTVGTGLFGGAAGPRAARATTGAGELAAAPTSVVHYHDHRSYSAIDALSFIEQLQSPTGRLREAHERMDAPRRGWS